MSNLTVYLEGFDAYSRRVRFIPPMGGSVEFKVVKRVEKDE